MKAGTIAAGKRIGTHTLRHSFARHMVANGIPLNQLQVWLGHESLVTTQVYLKLAPDTGGMMTTIPSIDSEISGLDHKQETAAFENRLIAQLDEAQANVLPYPETAHASIVRRAISRQRPFDEKGSGYRDTLIWLSVLEIAGATDMNVVLVSGDSDFKDDADNLHPDLINELSVHGYADDKVTLVTTVAKIIDEYIRPNLTEVLWENPLGTLTDLNFEVYKGIVSGIWHHYGAGELDPTDLELSPACETPTLEFVEDPGDLRIVDVRELPGHRYLVRVETDTDALFSTYVWKSDWDAVENDPRLNIEDYDWNDFGMLVAASVDLHVSCDLYVHQFDSGQHETEIRSVDPTAEGAHKIVEPVQND